MVNKCVVTTCSTSYKTGQKKASFHFHEDQELKRKWIYLVNRKDWLLDTQSYVLNFGENIIKRGKKMSTVAGTSCAVAITSSIYDSRCNPSLLRTPTPF